MKREKKNNKRTHKICALDKPISKVMILKVTSSWELNCAAYYELNGIIQ